MADNNNRASHVVYERDNLGSVKIADDVMACIAGLAAMEVEGETMNLAMDMDVSNVRFGDSVRVTLPSDLDSYQEIIGGAIA